MPLIVMCGLPSSGKTTRAKELAGVLEKAIDDYNKDINSSPLQIHQPTGRAVQSKIRLQPNVIVINEESLKINRAEAYRGWSSKSFWRRCEPNCCD
jgi:adenylate kinase family enzyme